MFIRPNLYAEIKSPTWGGLIPITTQEKAAVVYLFKVKRELFVKKNDSYYELNHFKGENSKLKNYTLYLKFKHDRGENARGGSNEHYK